MRRLIKTIIGITMRMTTMVMEKLKLKDLLINSSKKELEHLVENIHPVDVLEVLHELSNEKYLILDKLPDEFIAELIAEEDEENQYEILEHFPKKRQSSILSEISSDELADMLGYLDEDESSAIIEKLNEEDQKEVKQLLSYEPETAGGIMATEFVSIRDHRTVKTTLEYMQKNVEDAEALYYLYIVDKEDHLKGVVSLRDIVTKPFDTPIRDLINPNVISIPYLMDQEEVANIFEKYGFSMMPVVNEENVILGVITVDDIMQIVKEETTEDIHRLAGVDKEERVDSTVAASIKSRIPWLCVNLLTALLASYVVSRFEGTIAKVVTLATIMPVVTGMGGNAGTQSMTIMIRGIALGEIDRKNGFRIFLKEFGVGIIAGGVIGILIALIGYFIEGNVVFGFVVGTAMLLNMTVATIAGFIIPCILKKLKIDPALASSVFVTTVTDIFGFLFFLGLATIFINQLLP